MAAKVTTYPKSVEELVNSVWYSKLKTVVSNFRLNEPIEDTLGDIFLEMLEKNYLERWDPKAGSYSNWLYTFSSNVCRKKYNRSHTDGGKAIEGAASIQVASESDDFVAGVFFEETLNVDVAQDVSLDYNLLCEEIQAILAKHPGSSTNSYKGVVYKRDMLTVFNLLKEEYQPKEIAEVFNTSVEFIYTLIRRMRPLIVEVI